jgi:WD40 repeat protein
VKLWDTKTWREIPGPGLKGDNLNWSVAFRPDGRRLAVSEFDRVVVWDAATRTPVRTLLAARTFICVSVAFSPGGRLAASGIDGSVLVWDLSLPREVGPLAALVPPPPGLPRLLDVWCATTGLPSGALAAHEGRAMCVAFRPDGTALASAGLDGAIRLWDARTLEPAATLRGHLDGIHSLAFRPDGKRLASAGGDATIRVWDLATRRQVVTLAGHTDKVVAVAYSANGRHLASGGWDRTVKIWDAEPLPEARRQAAAGPDE